MEGERKKETDDVMVAGDSEDKIGCLVRHVRQCHLQIITKLGRETKKNNGVGFRV